MFEENAIIKEKTGLSQGSPGGGHIAPASTAAAATTTKGATRAICKIYYKQEASGGVVLKTF
jgi:hypothetical protein